MWKKPWMISQKWQDVLFLHWPIQPEELKQFIPKELTLDLYENKAWLGLVFFKVTGNRLRFMPPIPGVNSFLQLNVRTYVTYNGMKGIHFFSLDVNHSSIVKLATIGHFLPYRYAEISLNREGKSFSFISNVRNLNTLQQQIMATFEPIPGQIKSQPFEKWLVERYHLWTTTKRGIMRIDVSHLPWRLQHVKTHIATNSMAPFLKSSIQCQQPIAHYAKSKKARIFPPVFETKK